MIRPTLEGNSPDNGFRLRRDLSHRRDEVPSRVGPEVPAEKVS